jgi:hypothetical protein
MCPEDFFSASGAEECLPCAEGLHSEAGSASCFSCSPGKYYVDGQPGIKVEIEILNNENSTEAIINLEDFEDLTEFQAPASLLESGARGSIDFTSEFRAPGSGRFTFFVLSGCPTELLFGSNSTSNAVIASVPTNGEGERWDEFESQRSLPQLLVGGVHYYIKLRSTAESSNLTTFAVGVELPDSTILFPIPVEGFLTSKYQCLKCPMGKYASRGTEGHCSECSSTDGFVAPVEGLSKVRFEDN